MSSEPIKVYGVPELVSKLSNPVWAHRPARNLFERWGSAVEFDAKKNAPRDRRELQRSYTHETDPLPMPTWGKAGTNAKHAKPVEYGTGLLSDAPDSKHRRYFPPPMALDAWAIRHGFHTSRTSTDARKSVGLTASDAGPTTAPGSYGVIISRIIWRRGGTKPQRTLRNAADKAEKRIPEWVGMMASEIEAEASRGS